MVDIFFADSFPAHFQVGNCLNLNPSNLIVILAQIDYPSLVCLYIVKYCFLIYIFFFSQRDTIYLKHHYAKLFHVATDLNVQFLHVFDTLPNITKKNFNTCLQQKNIIYSVGDWSWFWGTRTTTFLTSSPSNLNFHSPSINKR